MNYSDAERVAAVLADYGYAPTTVADEADLQLFVTCSIRQKAEDRVYGLLRDLAGWKAARPGRQIGLTGCMVKRTSKRTETKPDPLLTKNVPLDFVWRIEDTGRLPELLGRGGLPAYGKTYFSIQPSRGTGAQVFVPIMTGCDNWCTYCVVPVTRGREVSRPAEEVLAECRAAVARGAQEITLLGQNVDSYAKRAGAFAELLAAVAELPGLARLRFTSSHPKDLDARVIDVLASHPKIERHLHLPAQHGDDAILSRMNRGYTAAEYLERIAYFREKVPDGSVTTDLIVGFPGETDQQFANLIEFYKKAAFEFAFIARYSPRPGTAAAKMAAQIPADVKATRWRELNELLRQTTAAAYARWHGRMLEVLVENVVDGVASGRSSQFFLVKFPTTNADLVGKMVRVRVTQPREVELIGEQIND